MNTPERVFVLTDPRTSFVELRTKDPNEAADWINDALCLDPIICEVFEDGHLIDVQSLHVIPRLLN